MAKAGDEVVVHHPDRLHERVADGGTDEAEAAFFQVLAHRVRFGRGGGNLLHRAAAVLPGLAIDELPGVAVEAAELALDRKERPGIGDRGLELEAVAHDARVAHECPQFARAETGDLRGVESCKRAAVVLPLPQYRVPGEARLRAFQDEELEQPAVIVHRGAPFPVVISDLQLIALTPRAAALHALRHCRLSR
jgi:hypothetical protein